MKRKEQKKARYIVHIQICEEFLSLFPPPITFDCPVMGLESHVMLCSYGTRDELEVDLAARGGKRRADPRSAGVHWLFTEWLRRLVHPIVNL